MFLQRDGHQAGSPTSIAMPSISDANTASTPAYHGHQSPVAVSDIAAHGTPPPALRVGAAREAGGEERACSSKPNAAEDELVRRLHDRVGGPAQLSAYEEPAAVRRVVLEALANEQASRVDASRVHKGQLSVVERRAVRTVTNRGAAVRSRLRQRREMTTLRHQLATRDARVRQLEGVVRALCSAYAVPFPTSITQPSHNDTQTHPGLFPRVVATQTANDFASCLDSAVASVMNPATERNSNGFVTNSGNAPVQQQLLQSLLENPCNKLQ